MKISTVIPCYNSEMSIRQVVEGVISELDKINITDLEFVLVNDNSKDGTFGEIKRLADQYPFVKGISLMRNFGQHNAIMCGMHYATGDYVVCMDDDLQTHPSQIGKLIKAITDGDYDIVYGVYDTKKNGAIKNFTSWLNKVSSRVLLGKPKGIRSSNYFIITDKLRSQLISYKGHNPSVDGVFFNSSAHIGNVVIEHHKREYGKSNYTFGKLVKLWITYFNFSMIPLRLATYAGIITAIAGFIGFVATLIRKLLHPSILAGWASIVCILLLFFGIVLMVLGIIGEYIGDILMTVNNSPQFIVREEINCGDAQE